MKIYASTKKRTRNKNVFQVATALPERSFLSYGKNTIVSYQVFARM